MRNSTCRVLIPVYPYSDVRSVAWLLSVLSLWPPLSYNINCQSVSTLSLRCKTLWGFHIKVLSIRVVGIIGGSVRTLDPSLPASTHLSAPNSPCLTSLLTSPSLSPPFVPRLKSNGKDLKQQSDEECEFKKGIVAVPAWTGDASFSTCRPIDSMEQALSSGQCFMPPR